MRLRDIFADNICCRIYAEKEEEEEEEEEEVVVVVVVVGRITFG